MPIVFVPPPNPNPSPPPPPAPSPGINRADLTEEILSNLQGFTAAPDQVTALLADMTETDATLRVADSTGVSSGILEIGDELVWATAFDVASGNVTLLPKGRGWRGTTPAAHPKGETVTISPNVPRQVVIREINNQIEALYPTLFGIKTTQFVHDDPLKNAWPLPADAEAVFDVRFQDFLGNWERVRNWEVEFSTDTALSSTGTAVRIGNVPIGYPVQIVYGTRPSPMTTPESTLADTGLQRGAKDLLVLGTLARILPMLDVSRLAVQHAAADELATPRPLGSASALADKFAKQYTQRLTEERRILNDRYPARIHWTR
jgi:hypothetical protein